MIDLRRLRVLRAVAHYGTITAAAEAMHFTTSAASQQIRQLARELDVTLLEPHGRRVRLTPAAHRLLAHADAIEARWEQAEIDLRTASDEPAGTVRLCGIPTAVAMLLAPAARPLRARYPRLDVRIREVEQEVGYNLLFDGEVDLAVVEATWSNPPPGDPRFDQRPLADDPFDLVVPADHALAGRDAVELVEAEREDWILPSVTCTCRRVTLAACGAAGFTPNVAHNALEWNAIAHLVANGLGVALAPRLAYLPTHLPIVRLPLTGRASPSRKLLTCTRAGGREHPAVAAVLTELSERAVTVAA
ncbi:LysR family transcriptional regulator [Actinophytocola gossypii]|uniref:LysR family transcriptional regulator n=1 Tax=Actinophytocola gossypii TaxID=2812003 RepID=A0ABT2J586_9PSEU|nr:LysR family transcriptional regulator [Actinophytocola gossypii]MCT2583033.1 LysR family transcriptional regulator [Actinophytocola gossypii]